MSFVDNIKHLAEECATKTKDNSLKDISESHVDRTYIGRVISKDTYNDTYSEKEIINSWKILVAGKLYTVNATNSDIKSVGQSVRLYLPNNDKSNAFAETINPAAAPDNIKYTKNDTSYADYKSYGVNSDKGIEEKDITIDTIVETWNLADKTTLERLYILTVINADEDSEEVTSILCPDGKQINLDGFFTND